MDALWRLRELSADAIIEVVAAGQNWTNSTVKL